MRLRPLRARNLEPRPGLVYRRGTSVHRASNRTPRSPDHGPHLSTCLGEASRQLDCMAWRAVEVPRRPGDHPRAQAAATPEFQHECWTPSQHKLEVRGDDKLRAPRLEQLVAAIVYISRAATFLTAGSEDTARGCPLRVKGGNAEHVAAATGSPQKAALLAAGRD